MAWLDHPPRFSSREVSLMKSGSSLVLTKGSNFFPVGLYPPHKLCIQNEKIKIIELSESLLNWRGRLKVIENTSFSAEVK